MKRVIIYLCVSAIYLMSCTKSAENTSSTINFQLKAANSPVNGSGIIWSAGIATPVSFEAAVPITIKSTKEIIEIAKGISTYNALTTLSLITLTTDVTEAEMKAAVRTAGKIIIARTSNDGIYFKMLANLAKNQIIEFKQ